MENIKTDLNDLKWPFHNKTKDLKKSRKKSLLKL